MVLILPRSTELYRYTFWDLGSYFLFQHKRRCAPEILVKYIQAVVAMQPRACASCTQLTSAAVVNIIWIYLVLCNTTYTYKPIYIYIYIYIMCICEKGILIYVQRVPNNRRRCYFISFSLLLHYIHHSAARRRQHGFFFM